jgi:hypothetical protein
MASQDGNFTTAFQQHGAKRVSLPLQQQGDYYATWTERDYIAMASYYDPVMSTRTAYKNLFTYSQDYDNGAWTKTNTTVSADAATDTEGATTADKILETVTNAAHSVSQGSLPLGALSDGVLVKAAERSVLRLRINNATDGNLAIAVFDLATGTVVSGTGTIKKLFGGWYWCYVSGTATVTGSIAYREIGSNTTTFSYAGTTTSGLYLGTSACYNGATMGPAVLTTAASRTVTIPPLDPDDPLAFLCEETPPSDGQLEMGVATWRRTYSRVPMGVTLPSSIIVAKPEPPGSGQFRTGSGLFFYQPTAENDQWDIYTNVSVTADAGVPSFYPSSGYYTLSYNGSTTSTLAYNAPSASVATALNALVPVASVGGVTVSGSYNTSVGFVVKFVVYDPVLPNIGSLTGSSPIGYGIGTAYGGRLQSVYIAGILTGGTYTLTIFGQTTSALNHNADTTTIAAAFNALSEVVKRGGCTIDGTGLDPDLGILFTINFRTPLITGVGSTLDTNGSVFVAPLPDESQSTTGAIIPSPYNYRQQVNPLRGGVYRKLTAPGNGAIADGTIFIQSASWGTYYVGITNYVIADSQSILLAVTPGASFATVPTFAYLGAIRIEDYEPGPRNIRCFRRQSYYLPLYSPGVSAAADIPLAQPQSDPVSFFSGLAASGATSLNYEVGSLDFWKGPIISNTLITVAVSDIL